MAQTLQDPATFKEKDIIVATFQLKPSQFSGEELAEIDRMELGVALTKQNRADRISRFDEVPSSSKLEIYRKKYRITQSKMAKMMGVSKRSYCDYESGQTPIPFDTLRKLAETTDLDFNELIIGDKSRAGSEYSKHIIRKTREIVAYCLNKNREISGAQAFEVAEIYAAEYGLDGDLWAAGIDDSIDVVTYDPEAAGIFE